MVKWIRIDIREKILSYKDERGVASRSIERKEEIELLAEIAVLLGISNPKGLYKEIRRRSDHLSTEEERR